MLFFIFSIVGLAVGSFINVISLRYEPGEKLLSEKTVGGRSRCPKCLKTLRWYELIPVFSFLAQKGRCRNCKKRISFQYILVEMTFGLIFALVPFFLVHHSPIDHWQLSQWLSVVVWLCVFSLFALLSIIDFRHFTIPNGINLSLGALGLVLAGIKIHCGEFGSISGSFLGGYAQIFGLRENVLINYSAAVLIGAVFFGAIIFFSKGKAMGLGDLKLIAALGLIFGWPDVLMVMILAFIAGSLASMVFLLAKRKKMKDAVPFGPFLAIGASLTFFFGYRIIDGYFKLFGL